MNRPRLIARVDDWQQRHAAAGFPLAVIYKLFDDRGLYLAALIAYYGFVSLFPLMLLFVSAAGFFLDGDPALRDRLIALLLRDVPSIGPQLGHSIAGFHRSGAALAVGIIGSLYGGLGVTQAAQTAFNRIYGVPRDEQPNPVTSRLRGVGLVLLLGTVVLVSTGIATLVSTATGFAAGFGPAAKALGYLVSLVINIALFTVAVQLLTARKLRVPDVIAGGVIAGVAWELLQIFGVSFVTHETSHATLLYGTFGTVITAIVWIYLQALVLILAAEINIVRHRRLWPRALLTPFTDHVRLTDADRRAYQMYAGTQRFKRFSTVRVDFDDQNADRPG